MSEDFFNARVTPLKHLDLLSKIEVDRLLDSTKGEIYALFRQCALAVLNHGNYSDDVDEIMMRYQHFDIRVIQEERGIVLEVKGAPNAAFVDGKMIRGINEHLFSVLRDIVYLNDKIIANSDFDLTNGEGITNAIFHIMRNAGVLKPRFEPQLVVCWGGHSISRIEYSYTKTVGYELGLRGLDICTGCGPGAMKGPMKGATFGHAKQRISNGRYLGMTEPGIIAAESPNPIVNDLIILPDIEKRLEAFVRVGHGIIVFPGGVGTTEEILYILGILMHPDNKFQPFPLIFTAPESSRDYFIKIDAFIASTLGPDAQKHYQIIIADPEKVARAMFKGIAKVKTFRRDNGDAVYYNWLLKIEKVFQKPFIPTHENMAKLAIHKKQPAHLLAAALRCVFSGIVSGNVKHDGIQAIKKHGLFQINGDSNIMLQLDQLLTSFVEQQRMKLPGTTYKPCYQLVKSKKVVKQ